MQNTHSFAVDELNRGLPEWRELARIIKEREPIIVTPTTYSLEHKKSEPITHLSIQEQQKYLHERAHLECLNVRNFKRYHLKIGNDEEELKNLLVGFLTQQQEPAIPKPIIRRRRITKRTAE